MVYTANWGNICHLRPIKGTRNSYWKKSMTGGSFIHICYFHPENGGCIFSKLTTDSSELFILKEWQKKKRQEKNEPRFGVLQFATQLSKLEYCSCVMSWPSMVYDLAIAKRSGAFVKKWGGSKNRGDVSRVSRWFPGNTKLKGVVNYIMNRRKFTPNGILEEVKDVFVGISLNSDEWFLGVKIHTMWWYDYLKLLLTL